MHAAGEGKRRALVALKALPFCAALLLLGTAFAFAQEQETEAAPAAAPTAQPSDCGGVPTGSSAFAAVTSFFGAKSRSLLSRMRAGNYCASTQAIGDDRDVNNQRVAYKYGLVHLPEFTAYATGILEKLKAEVPIKGIPGVVHVLGTEELAAHSTADGNIFISLGWLRTLKTEGALIALLAHELGHVVLGHHESDMFTSIQKQFQLLAAGAGTIRRAMENFERLGVAQGTLTGRDMQKLKRLQALIEISDQLIHPAWNRRQELEADRFAIDLTQKLGYAYTPSVKTFLEHVADFEEQQNARAEVNKVELQEAAQIDLGRQFANELKRLQQSLTSRHDDAGVRLTDAQRYYTDTYPKPSSATSESGDFTRVMQSRAVLQVLDGYQRTFKASELMSQGQAREALAEAQRAAGQRGPVAAHAFPLLVLSQALRLSGQAKLADAALARSLSAPERTFSAFREHADLLVRAGRRAEATKVMEQSFDTFSGAPNLYPELIAFYTRQGGSDRGKQLLLECFIKLPTIRESCDAAAKAQ